MGKTEIKEGTPITSFADRFYRTLYDLILKVHMSKATSLDDYFGMVFKAIKGDENIPRSIAFIKRLLQMSYLNEANFTCASLLIISEILKARQDLKHAMFPQNIYQSGEAGQSKAPVSTYKLDQGSSDDEEVFVDVDK